jgi:PBP1b-binding outer membrane lipoprotein LpoB
MKNIVTFALLALSLFMFGCASTSDSVNTIEKAPESGASTSSVAPKTAYDGTTGSGLLMERYRSGQIQGYRD